MYCDVILLMSPDKHLEVDLLTPSKPSPELLPSFSITLNTLVIRQALLHLKMLGDLEAKQYSLFFKRIEQMLKHAVYEERTCTHPRLHHAQRQTQSYSTSSTVGCRPIWKCHMTSNLS